MSKKLLVVFGLVLSLLLSACTINNPISDKQKKSTVESSVQSCAEQFFNAFCTGDVSKASQLCIHEKRMLDKIDKDRYISQTSHMLTGSAEMYSQTTGLKTGYSSLISKPRKVDDNHFQIDWTFGLGGEKVTIPNITVVRSDGKWLIDFESFAIPFTKFVSGGY